MKQEMRLTAFMAVALAGVLCLLSVTAVADTRQEPRESGPADILADCGIKTDSQSLTLYLEQGNPLDLNADALKKHLIPATQTMILAMQELASRRWNGAVELLCRTAREEYTPAQRSFVNFDCRNVPRSMQEERRLSLYMYLQYNAMNALGLIGDLAAFPTLHEAFEKSKPGAFRISAALGLACLNSTEGMDYLITAATGKSHAIEAMSALSFITGLELDYQRYTPVIRRARTVKIVEAWWKENREFFRPDGEAIITRRREALRPIAPDLDSLRGLLNAASLAVDITTERGSFEARERLGTMGPMQNGQLEVFCLDVEEDLNIRIEALRRYTETADIQDVRRVLKAARKDRNPEIKGLAKTLLSQLENRKK